MVWERIMAKIAVTGKGGVGKTTIAAGLARTFGSRGYRVIALDMDPSPNLASSLSCSPRGCGIHRPARGDGGPHPGEDRCPAGGGRNGL